MAEHNPISIFINYRRADTRDMAREFKRNLEAQLGREANVFLDERNIRLTEDWQPKLKEELRKAEIMLSLIGPDWENQMRARHVAEDGTAINDWVRFEIRQARAERIDIIPIFIDREKADIKQLLPEEFPEAARVFNGQGFVFKKNAHDEAMDQLIKSLKIFTGRDTQSHHKVPELDYLAALPLDQDIYLSKLWEKDEKGAFKVDSPFPGPIFFSEQEALLYAGRKKEVRTLYHLIRQHRLVLLHGYSGSGKSSLIHAGLFSRMKNIDLWQVLPPVRRSKALGGLAQQLKELLDKEVYPEQRVLIVLDQVEEMYNDPLDGPEGYSEIQELGKQLKEIWSEKKNYHLVLTFRSEFLSQVKEEFLPGCQLFHFKEFYLSPLKEANIQEAILEPVTNPGIQNRFKLTLSDKKEDEGLVGFIAKDFTGDKLKPYGVLLQIQLKALWEAAVEAAKEQDSHDREFTKTLYEKNRKTNLAAYIEEQLETIQRIDKKGQKDEKWERAVGSGLILDVLFQFTTIEDTAGSISNEDFSRLYSHLVDPGPQAILNKLKSVYLLSAADILDQSSRLAHDSLAHDIRRKYQESQKPGQKARRLYESKKAAFPGSGVLFSEQDARTILDGLDAMAAIPDDHKAKIKTDLKTYEDQHQKNYELAFKTAEKNIEHLEFEEAVDNLEIAMLEKLHTEEVLEKVMELPYPLAFLGAKIKLKKIIELIVNILGESSSWKSLESKIDTCSEARLFPILDQWLKHPENDLHKVYEKMQVRFSPKMISILGDSFRMGSDDGFYKNEEPIHKVNLSDFELAETPVTCWQYGLYCLEKGIPLPGESGFGRGDKPVININWYDAIRYCNWLTERLSPLDGAPLEKVYAIEGEEVIADWTKNGFRLPTEAEWEFAARAVEDEFGKPRGGGAVHFANSQNVANPAEMNFDAGHPYNEKYAKGWHVPGKGKGMTTRVKEFLPNALGFYDMSGNIYEWCWDWYDEGYYEKSPEKNPKGPESGEFRVVRGGSWHNDSIACRSAYRYRLYPILQLNNIGFRLARRL